MIFFDVDDTLIDNKAEEDAAAREFHRLHADVFQESPDEFVGLWKAATERHVARYLSGELTFQGQRRERLRDIFARNGELTDRKADILFEAYLSCHEQSWRLSYDT